ncbi:DUF945 domain-containing protein [Salmonella enterica subsp. enterica serovar Mississippi]|nr:DUF945 domain-containing protein [Salmonella enterica subsp. enterica serovar Mississippi]
MTRLSALYGNATTIRRDRPLTHDELMRVVPGVFSDDKHTSRSEHYTYIPTITVLESLQREGFEPFFACQARVRDPDRREYSKHLLRLRRAGQITQKEVQEIVLLNSHDGSSSYRMMPGMYRQVCSNGLVCSQSFGDIRIPHKGDIVNQVIEGAYEVLGVFDRIEQGKEAMQAISLSPLEQKAYASAALNYRFGDGHKPITEAQALSARRWEDEKNDLWTTFQRVQENLVRGGLSGRSAQGKRSRTRAVKGIDGDLKLNRALWVMAEELQQALS